MRLNFSNQDEDSIREGIRRIGKVIEEQVALYGTLTGEDRAVARERRAAAAEEPEGEGARIVPMPSRRPGKGRASR